MTAIAIDGPAGAGKSTVARAVAEKLGFTYVDTGAMYRAVALCALEQGVAPTDAERATRVAAEVHIAIQGARVLVGDRDVTSAIRNAEVTSASAEIAKHPGVREALVRLQRRMADETNVVMEGRDIGTTVLPGASVKVFLTASLDERAARRGLEAGRDIDSIKDAIAARDEADSNREASPLTKAPDAVLVDSTGKSIEAVVDEVVSLIGDRS